MDSFFTERGIYLSPEGRNPPSHWKRGYQGVFRLNIGVSKQKFQTLFGSDEVNLQEYDFTALGGIVPHPEYVQYHYICALSPGEETFEKVHPFLAEAYDISARRYTSQNKVHFGMRSWTTDKIING